MQADSPTHKTFPLLRMPVLGRRIEAHTPGHIHPLLQHPQHLRTLVLHIHLRVLPEDEIRRPRAPVRRALPSDDVDDGRRGLVRVAPLRPGHAGEALDAGGAQGVVRREGVLGEVGLAVDAFCAEPPGLDEADFDVEWGHFATERFRQCFVRFMNLY
jgi:hypothetical protein